MFEVEVDRGWSWLVCVGGVIAQFLETGMVEALSILLPVLRQQFATKTWSIGLMISFVPGFGAVTCPLASALSKRFSARYTVIAFSFVGAFGLIIGALSASIPAIVVAFLLASSTFGTEAIVFGELARYFDANYTIANAIAQMGMSLGIMVIPPLTQMFLDVYGWRGTMLLLGGLHMHLILCGVVMRPINIIENGQSKKVNIKPQKPETPKTSEQSTTKQTTCAVPASFLHRMVFYLDLELFQDTGFISIMWYNFGNGYCLTGWLIYLVPYAMDIGYSPYHSTSLATFGGIGNLIGNAMYPLMLRVFTANQVLYSSTVISCFALALNPVFSDITKYYLGLILATAAFGCGRGIAMLCSYQMAKERADVDARTNSIMWISVSYSLGSIAAGFLSGWVYDQIGSFALSFCILSGVAILSVVPQFIIDMKKLRQDNYNYKLVSS